MEKGLEVFYWFGAPTRIAGSVLGLTSIISKEARVPLGFQQFGTKKGGREVSRVQVDDTSLTEYLEFGVLEGEVGSSFCYPVEVWFYGPRLYEYGLWISW